MLPPAMGEVQTALSAGVAPRSLRVVTARCIAEHALSAFRSGDLPLLRGAIDALVEIVIASEARRHRS
jgi:hypothetical protein